MQITVFGASGKVGRIVVQILLSKGYDVVAFVHNDSPFKINKNLKILNGDVHSKADIKNALIGSDAVISTLGSWNTQTKDVLSAAIKLIIPEMNNQGISRIVSLTGADATINTDKITAFNKLLRPVIKLFAAKILKDGEDHLRQLAASNLTWTVLRSPIMRSSSPSGKYVLDYNKPRPWQRVNRGDVATALCLLLTEQKYNNSSPYIY